MKGAVGITWAPARSGWRDRLPTSASRSALLASIAGAALLAGAAVGIGLGVPALLAAVAAAIVAPLALRFGVGAWAAGANGAFWTALTLALVLNALSLVSPVKVGGLMELWLLALSPWIVASAPAAWRDAGLVRLFALLFAVALVFAAASTLLAPHRHAKAALYQLAYNAKWPLMLLLGYRACWQDADHRRLWRLMQGFVAVAMAFIVLDLAAPGVFQRIARNVTEFHHTHNPLLGGMGWRLTGPFIHSSVLAYFSAVFLVLTVIQQQAGLLPRGRALRLALAMLGLLALSGQMQEAAAALFACGLVVVAFRVRSLTAVLVAAGGVLLLALAVLLASAGVDRLDGLLAEWGLVPGLRAITSARPVFYADALRLATGHFPLGTGLGSFAGVGAQLYNRELYTALGYDSLWWYARDIFLLDTYWPNFIAEQGWIAAACLFVVPLLGVGHALQRLTRASGARQKAAWAYAFCGQFLPLAVSLTSPIYSDPNMAAFALLMLGMAHRYEQRLASARPAGHAPMEIRR